MKCEVVKTREREEGVGDIGKMDDRVEGWMIKGGLWVLMKGR